jgi:hypothetical protein
MTATWSPDCKKSGAEVSCGPSGGALRGSSTAGGINLHIQGTMRLKIVLVGIHQRSINGQKEKESVKLSPGNINGVWKRIEKGTNTPYEKIYTSLVYLLVAFAAVGAARRGASSVQFHDQ